MIENIFKSSVTYVSPSLSQIIIKQEIICQSDTPGAIEPIVDEEEGI